MSAPGLPRGFTVDVLVPRGLGDCTNGGISATAPDLTVVGVVDRTSNFRLPAWEELPQNWRLRPATDLAPPALLCIRGRGLPGVLIPLRFDDDVWEAEDGPVMMGGHWAYSSDSRWESILSWAEQRGGPIAIHDRLET